MMMMMADAVRTEMEERNLRPRLCYLTKGYRGYGFHLHGERSHGAQFIRKIEEGSPAELAGLRSGDRVVEVNGENVEKVSHQQVVQKIMEVENRTRLLVVDRETDEFLLLHSLPCTEELAVEMSCLRSPRNSTSSLVSSPQTSCSSSPRHSITQSLQNSLTHSFSNSIPPSPRDSMANSLQNSVATSLCNSVSLSSCDSTGSSASGSVTPTRNSITPSPCEIVTQLRSNSASPSSHGSTPPFTRGKSIEVQMMESTVITNGNKSPSTSVPVMNGSPIPGSDPVIPSCPSDPQQECTTTFSGADISVQVHIKEISAKRDSVTQDLRPRLCHMLMGENGFGFNLHCDKRREGQYIRSVDPDSPAQRAGLLPGDRLIQVNDRSVQGLRHVDVVELIKGGGGETNLLVVDPETDALFKKLGITPTTAHLKEDCVDGPIIESPASNRPIREENSSPTKLQSSVDICPPIVQVTLTDPPITNGRVKHQSHGSSSSRSTLSEMSVELSGSDTGSKEKIFDSVCNSALGGQLEVDEIKALDPLWESGLRLSPTAAEARQKVRAKRAKKTAPPMAWSKKHEIFSNF